MRFLFLIVLFFIKIAVFAQADDVLNQLYNNSEFNREQIKSRLNKKIRNNEFLIVRILVPLCDNVHQGIVPVSTKLGDGMNLNTNLYWGAGYGIKTHFKRLKNWSLISEKERVDSNILERVIFRKIYPNKTKVIVIADAYRGDKMYECLIDYFNILACKRTDYIFLDSIKIEISKNADLLCFNGHNGLMEHSPEIIINNSKKYTDAVAIACVSDEYFSYYFKQAKAYPLVVTTSLLPPEAYILQAIIDNWALMQDEKLIANSAGDNVARIFKKSKTACRKMFKTGW